MSGRLINRIKTPWVFGCSAVLLILLAMASCSSRDPMTSLLEGDPCAAPCWQGITPGITDQATALSILSDPEIAEQDSIETLTSLSDPNRSRVSFRITGDGGCRIGLVDRTVKWIDISGGHQLTLGELLDNLGDPDLAYVEEWSQDTFCYWIVLFYQERGILVKSGICANQRGAYETAWIEGENHANIYSGMTVDFMILAEPNPDRGFPVGDYPSFTSAQLQRTIQNAQSWTGFGWYPVSPQELP